MHISSHRKKVYSFFFLLTFVIGVIIFFTIVNPEQLVEQLGVHNGYLLLFFVSLFGGFSAGGSVTFISLLVALTLGGLNPVYLGVVAGISLSIGDMVMFLMGSQGRDLLKGETNEKLTHVASIFKKNRILKKITPFLAYLYMGLTPLPNDLLLLFLAGIKYPRKYTFVIIVIGDLTFPLTLTLSTAFGANAL